MSRALRSVPMTCSTAVRSAMALTASRRSIATTISTLMRTMTITISSSVKPRARTRAPGSGASATRDARELPHRQEDAERQDQHQAPHHQEQDRLARGGEG